MLKEVTRYINEIGHAYFSILCFVMIVVGTLFVVGTVTIVFGTSDVPTVSYQDYVIAITVMSIATGVLGYYLGVLKSNRKKGDDE